MTRHILITGGAGFIGSHLVDAFVDRGWKVSIIDDLSTGRRENVNAAASFFEADLRDPKTVALLDDLHPDVVAHEAAQMDVRKSVAEPAFDAETNVVASVRLLQKCVDVGTVKQFLFASTGGAIYGEPVYAPQDEAHPMMPLSPYGCAKLSVEHYMNYFREVRGLATTALRYANVYGPRQSPHGEAGVVAIFASRMLRGEDVTINGTGEQTRDYVNVADVVAANVAVVEQGLTGAFNVGTGVETSVNEMYAVMASILGITQPAQHGPAKVGEQLRSVLDGSRLRGVAGLSAPVPFRDGLARTLAWFRDRVH